MPRLPGDAPGPATGPAVLRFGDFVLDTGRFELRRGDELLHLQPKAFDLLQVLLRHADRVVEKDELLATVWPGVVVTEHSLTRCIKDLRKALDDDAAAPRYIETVARRGYRMLVQPEHQAEPPREAAGAGLPVAPEPAAPEPSALAPLALGAPAPQPVLPVLPVNRPRARWLGWALVVVALAATLLLVLAGRSPPEAGTSIAVLPFVSPGSDEQARAFADGVAEDLLDRLAQVPQLQVVARTSSFAFRGEGQDARQIGRALGVVWLLEGSARRDGERIVVTAQLVDTRSGYRAWSQRLERPQAGLFKLQDEIAQAIAEQVARHLAPAPLPEGAHRPRDLQAHQAFLLGRDYLYRQPPGWADKAADAFASALQREPGYARAHAGLSIVMSLRASTAADLSRGLAQAAEHAERALALDPKLGLAHAAQGLWHLQRRDGAAAEPALRRAVALDPQLAPAYGWLAQALAAQSRADEGLAALQAGLRVDPLNPALIEDLAAARTGAGRWDEAHELYARLLRLPVVPLSAAPRLGGLELSRGRLTESLRWALRGERERADRDGAQAGIATAVVLARLGLAEAARDRLRRVDVSRPLKAASLLDMELAWRMLGRTPEIDLLSQATAAAATRPWPSWLAEHRARVLMLNGRGAEGLALLADSTPAGRDFGGGGPALDAQLLRVWVLRQSGREAEAQALAGPLLEPFDRGHGGAGVAAAVLHAMARTLAGQPEMALTLLERENEAQRLDPAMLLEDDPRWAPLRTLPRWQAVVRAARAHQAGERARLQARLAAGDPAFAGMAPATPAKP